MYAGMAYRSVRAVDGTVAGHLAYQSMHATPVREQESELYTIGDKIEGRYEVLAVHRGSMGVVYGTFDHEEKLPRAIKTLQRRFASNLGMRDLFREEASLWVRLERHPFIVRAYSVMEINAQPYVITEYIRGQAGMGGDLRAWLGLPGLTLPVAVEMALQIAQGMQHATRKIPGMVHRDLKPANVIVDEHGRAMVTDFGLVCAADSQAGTPAYMAPEQWKGLPLEARTDIYSFGCILYEMFTGHRMFPAEKIHEWKTAHISLSPILPRTLSPALPAELEVLVMRCLDKNLLNRPEGWDYLANEFARWFFQLTGQPPVLNFSAYDLTLFELLQANHSLCSLYKLPEALEASERALEIDTTSAEAWLRQGETLRLLGHNEDALAAYEIALEIDPDSPMAWTSKGIALLYMDCVGNLDMALAAIAHALTLDSNYAHAWYCRAEALHWAGRLEEALVAYERSLTINPNNSHAWKDESMTLNALGRSEEALAASNRALAIDPSIANTWNTKGAALAALSRWEEALASYDSALELLPNSTDAWLGNAKALSNLGRGEEALGSYDHALAIMPEHTEAWYEKGKALGELGRWEEALSAYDQAVECWPDFVDGWICKGNSLSSLGRWEEALSAYDKALKLDPKNEDARRHKSTTLAVMPKTPDAPKVVVGLSRWFKWTKGQV
jgi:tetratricopeptide (TPR) repeat protein